MVSRRFRRTASALAVSLVALSLAAAEEPARQLDKPTGVRVLMALLGLVLLGVALIALAMLLARWARRGGTVPKRERSLEHLPSDWDQQRASNENEDESG